MKITEEVLKDLGFVQQNPPHIWDYAWDYPHNSEGPKYLRMFKSNYGGKEQWMFQYRGESPIMALDLMSVIRGMIVIAYHKGVRDTEDKLHDALGFHRLIERFADRIRDEDD